MPPIPRVDRSGRPFRIRERGGRQVRYDHLRLQGLTPEAARARLPPSLQTTTATPERPSPHHVRAPTSVATRAGSLRPAPATPGHTSLRRIRIQTSAATNADDPSAVVPGDPSQHHACARPDGTRKAQPEKTWSNKKTSHHLRGSPRDHPKPRVHPSSPRHPWEKKRTAPARPARQAADTRPAATSPHGEERNRRHHAASPRRPSRAPTTRPLSRTAEHGTRTPGERHRTSRPSEARRPQPPPPPPWRRAGRDASATPPRPHSPPRGLPRTPGRDWLQLSPEPRPASTPPPRAQVEEPPHTLWYILCVDSHKMHASTSEWATND